MSEVVEPVLIDGAWRASHLRDAFSATNPATGDRLPARFPVSAWKDVDLALDAAMRAADSLLTCTPNQIAAFMDGYAARIESSFEELAGIAIQETGLPIKPRLIDQELPRTVLQLREYANAARDGSWALPTIDVEHNVRSIHAPIGPVVVFGPNNFPFAYNGVSGTDFAAAIAAGNPVIAKAHPLHPNTSRRLANCALEALLESDLPAATVQMIYALSNADGVQLVADPRVGAIGFTGSRAGGLKLKAVADAVGKPIYLELSSINPVVMLPGALESCGDDLVKQLADSAQLSAGQFCTSPGLVVLIDGSAARAFVDGVVAIYRDAIPQTMLSHAGVASLSQAVQTVRDAGAELLVGGLPVPGPRAAYAPTLLRTSGESFLANPQTLQTEMFGTASLVVACRDLGELCDVLCKLEGNLTGSIYSHESSDNEAYAKIERILRRKVGRLLNDAMPTGVRVSPAMQHGGPFPATGHPGFTAVGAPATLRRFSQLQCYDRVRSDRLPRSLR
jgi:NADP-dependent aldehyde dehydrogenase